MVTHRTESVLSTLSQVIPGDSRQPLIVVTVSRVGFNPFREHEKTTLDIVLVVVALLAIVAVIAWAVFSG